MKNPKPKFSDIFSVRLSDFSYIFCVRQETLVLGSLINRFYAEEFDELGLLVNPINVKSNPVKYLSDLVTIVNKKIQRIREGDKSGNTKIGKLIEEIKKT